MKASMEYLNISEKEEIIRDLALVINRHNLERLSNTPDFVIAEYLFHCIMNHADSINARNAYYGRDDSYKTELDEDLIEQFTKGQVKQLKEKILGKGRIES